MSFVIFWKDVDDFDSKFMNILSSPISLGIIFTLVFILPNLIFFIYKKNNKLDSVEYLVIDFMRYAIALLMFYYGATKIDTNFFDYTYRTMDSRVIDVHYFDLAWYFFGKSNLQSIIIGVMELVPAILILFRRTYFLGILLLLPVAGNVLWTNIFNSISGFTYYVSLIIVLLSSYILYSKKVELITFLKNLLNVEKEINMPERIAINSFKYLSIFAISSFGLLTIYKIANHKSQEFPSKKGAFELVELKINNVLTTPKSGELYYKTIYLESQDRWNSIIDFKDDNIAKWITIKRIPKTDKVVTYLKLENAVENSAIDLSSKFEGTYIFKDSLLLVTGIQNNDSIFSIYKRKKLDKKKWYW